MNLDNIQATETGIGYKHFIKDTKIESIPPIKNYIFPDGIYGDATYAAFKEIMRAKTKHKNLFASHHEGFAILKEEVDELWDEVKKDNHEAAVYEAVQVAAMALRFVAEFGTPPYRKPELPTHTLTL